MDGRIKYLGYDWSPWKVSEKPSVSLDSSLFPFKVPSLYCLVSEGRGDRGNPGTAGSGGDCGGTGGGDPRHHHPREEEENVTKQIQL